MVRRSAWKSAQTSALTSSMISSMLLVAWILFVTAWSCFWNARRTPTSVCVAACGLRTALIHDLPGAASSRTFDVSPKAPDLQRELPFLKIFFNGFQPPVQHPYGKAALCKEEGRGSAPAPALAVGDVLPGTV